MRPLLTKIRELKVLQPIVQMYQWGMVAPGFNVTRQTSSEDLLGLIKRLRPLDCGKKLIRIGGAGDGGYLIPDDLDGIEYCFSPGVGPMSEFESQLADRKIMSFLADYSVDTPPTMRPEFTFDKKYLGSTNSERFMTLASWKDKYLKGYTGDLILQMDIEGAEYRVILSTPNELLSQFRILVIEFHGLDRLFDPVVFQLYYSCFDKLLESFYIAHIHPNNCCRSVRKGSIEVPRVMEFTFLHKKRVRRTEPLHKFPNELDAPTFSSMRELRLPECWHSGI
jgi:hypothetical protein